MKINTSIVSTSTDHQLKENKHTSDTAIFGPMSSEKPNAKKSVRLFKGFYYYVVFRIQLGCQKWLSQ